VAASNENDATPLALVVAVYATAPDANRTTAF
jgi:hypothetical protein